MVRFRTRTRGDRPIAENAEPKVDACAAEGKRRLGRPNLTRIDSRLACAGNRKGDPTSSYLCCNTDN
jgi:hypothetical protein